MRKCKLVILCFVGLITIGNPAIAQQPKSQLNKEAKPNTVHPRASFLEAYSITMQNEGGYVNDKNDIGGETYCGITRKNFPEWAGWTFVDKHKMKHNEKLPELNQLVQDFYKTNFWNKIRGDEINDQDLANQIFDEAVNAGIKTAIIMAQESVGVKKTGVMDDATINAISK